MCINEFVNFYKIKDITLKNQCFGTDPGPRIHTTDLRITKNKFFKYFFCLFITFLMYSTSVFKE
jgi:hypothetical protein